MAIYQNILSFGEVLGKAVQLVHYGSMIKLCQLTDDMSLFLTDSDSVRNTVNIFEEFYGYAGLKLNKTKTVVFLVNPKHVHLKDESLAIKYTDKPFKSLGI